MGGRPEPVIVASHNGAGALRAGIEILRSGGTALDAVETCTRVVEADPGELYVGDGSVPNILGEVELDATIMDGTTLLAGAVAGLRGYVHAVTVARAVMERTPHVLLVAEGAERLAAEIGEPRRETLRQDLTRDMWVARLAEAGYAPDTVTDHGELAAIVDEIGVTTHGTVDFLALDSQGNLASAVSTSGWPFAYPGRVGDSGVIGAGNYADSRWGSAANIGLGELAIRAGTARMAVERMRAGSTAPQAAEAAIADVSDLDAGASFTIHVLAPDGSHAAATTLSEGTYAFQTVDMAEPATPERITATR